MRQLIKFNINAAFEKNFELSFHKVESAILYSAFIIRKLIESEKLSDDADNYSLVVKAYLPKRRIDRLHHWSDEDEYDWDKYASDFILGKYICNQLIHSYVLQLRLLDNDAASGFLVSSDYNRNNRLIEVSIVDWINYIDMIIKDDVVDVQIYFDKKKDDYITSHKKRGN